MCWVHRGFVFLGIWLCFALGLDTAAAPEPHIRGARRGRTSRGSPRGRWWQGSSRLGTTCPQDVLMRPDVSALSQERGGVTPCVDLAAVVMDSRSPVAEPLSAARWWCRVGIPGPSGDAVAPWGGGPGKVGE